MASCSEKFGDKVEGFIASSFHSLGNVIGFRPKQTIIASFVLTLIMGAGFASWEIEYREDKLWVPQDTLAEAETEMYQEYFSSTARISTMIVQSSTPNGNILTKENLEEAMQMHNVIETRKSTYEGQSSDLIDLCVKAGGACVSKFDGVCNCLVNSILKQWNYDLATLQNDADVLATIKLYGKNREDFEAVLGNPVFDGQTGELLSAEAFTLSYFLQANPQVNNGIRTDPLNEQWERDVFLNVAESVPEEYPDIAVDYFSSRSFDDEFGDEIGSDISLVQISYIVAFLFLGANLGKIKCGTGSRWTMALAALVTVGLSTAAGFGLSSLCGLFFGPVHSLLPFILLGIGVDDTFVIVNAFNRERKTPRTAESNEDLRARCARSLARAGASITVTSATDLVAFGISSNSNLPALASFCAYAAISIFFLWFFAATFFTATLVLDERRQRDNRRECLCCVTRKNPIEEEEDDFFQEDLVSRYFRNYHAPAILSNVGKVVVLLIFSGLLAFGIWGAMNLTVEDTQRAFIPADSYLQGYFSAADEYFPDTGITLYVVFEGSSDIYDKRVELADLDERVKGLSKESPFIAEPVSNKAYHNVMTGLSLYLNTTSSGMANVTLGPDNWPTTEEDFVKVMKDFTTFGAPGSEYAPDVIFSEDQTKIEAFRVQLEYVRLTKLNAGEIIEDADRQIEAMDDTRDLVNSWTDLPERFPYSDKFLTIEGFKIIKRELFMNVGLAIAAVGVIVFFTVASPVTALLITLNVAACIVEILGFMHALGIVIDSVSVINIVLAVGLSVDYSAHVGHCFMVKGGDDKNQRALEALADIGAAVLNGALSTFLAVVVLLFSTSYVFVVLSKQFALTVALGITHGLICLPVLLSVFGPKPFSSAEAPHGETPSNEKEMTKTAHSPEIDTTEEAKPKSEEDDA